MDHGSMAREIVKQLFDAWAVYDRVLDHNYMFHEEIYSACCHPLLVADTTHEWHTQDRRLHLL